MPVTTVVFDYGGVLSRPIDPRSLRALARMCALPVDLLAAAHRRERAAYDRADLDLAGYWSRILALGGKAASDGLLDELNREDLRGWSRIDARVLSWARELRRAGFRTAILSNMPQPILDLMKADPAFGWMEEFPVRVFSCEVRMAKPEPGIYRHLLARLGEAMPPAAPSAHVPSPARPRSAATSASSVGPESCLFLDDTQENVDGARRCGLHAFRHHSAEETAGVAAALGLSVDALLHD